MRAFRKLLQDQISGDLRSLPMRVRRLVSPERRLARARNIDDLRTLARSSVPRTVFDFIDGAANDELALLRNRQGFRDIQVYPRSFVDVSTIDLSTDVLGTRISMPILGAPTGLSGLAHADGEVGIARAVHAAGSIYTLSSMASYSIEELAREAPGPKWFQLYLLKDLGFVRELLVRARESGYLAVVVTADVARAGRRERDQRNGFSIPPRVTVRSLLGGVRHPGWSTSFVRHERFVIATMPANAGSSKVVDLAEFNKSQFDASVTWERLEWLREQWTGPIVVKGLMHPDDALRATRIGANAIGVSNHGGRQLDDAPSSISMLPAVVDAVSDSAEIFLDSGIRRGSDVLKALASGARACLVGRPLLYGLAVAGEPGVARALSILSEELETAMALAGANSVDVLNASYLVR